MCVAVVRKKQLIWLCPWATAIYKMWLRWPKMDWLAGRLTHTHTHNHFMALWNLSGTTQVSRYQQTHSPTHTHRGYQSSLSAFSIYYDPWHPLYSRALQSFSTISLKVFFGLPLGLVPSTSYSIHFFTQSLSSFRSTWPYHRNLFCSSTQIMSSNSSLPLNSLLGTLSCNFTPHIHLVD